MTIRVTQTSVPRYRVAAISGRPNLVPFPPVHVTLAASRARYVTLASSAPIEHRGNRMDGIAEITIRQFQRVTLLAYVVTVDNVAITQSDVQSIHAAIFRPSVEGGDPVWEGFHTVSDVVYDTIQYDAKDQDGYNLAVEFLMETADSSKGTSTYQLEVAVELTTGESIPVLGRVVVDPCYLSPTNAY